MFSMFAPSVAVTNRDDRVIRRADNGIHTRKRTDLRCFSNGCTESLHRPFRHEVAHRSHSVVLSDAKGEYQGDVILVDTPLLASFVRMQRVFGAKDPLVPGGLVSAVCLCHESPLS